MPESTHRCNSLGVESRHAEDLFQRGTGLLGNVAHYAAREVAEDVLSLLEERDQGSLFTRVVGDDLVQSGKVR